MILTKAATDVIRIEAQELSTNPLIRGLSADAVGSTRRLLVLCRPPEISEPCGP
ncbi:MAG: hypothetical protein JWO14_1144 [Solirubrobacterales bacterium]|nr:hypothetical protein [Solirubrobacterales bacterium]